MAHFSNVRSDPSVGVAQTNQTADEYNTWPCSTSDNKQFPCGIFSPEPHVSLTARLNQQQLISINRDSKICPEQQAVDESNLPNLVDPRNVHNTAAAAPPKWQVPQR